MAGSWWKSLDVPLDEGPPGVHAALARPDLLLMLGRGDSRRSWSSIMSASVEPGNGELALLPVFEGNGKNSFTKRACFYEYVCCEWVWLNFGKKFSIVFEWVMKKVKFVLFSNSFLKNSRYCYLVNRELGVLKNCKNFCHERLIWLNYFKLFSFTVNDQK